ncbi:3-oxoacyl-[acyl-carrier protein] reductase [Antricoccus suffuscus]|uniref:3-oxoacyl-[acyl-carrier protein] reductase n=1 Tax=Antricoccus suffuscus TaxID=1629062 RepID=A0A2T0ZBL7_9ACTN|nr:SDR family oxidoreductase [Antricoccus suffuscus]PRZ33548.1 3-oxoacyl-[acyl-carrier protein] reductase [Antricoccus suffuscus]
MDLGLTGRRVLVTGATDGLGKAIAEGYIDEGAVVFGAGRNQQKAMPEGCKGSSYVDLSTDGAPERLVESAAASMGGIDTVIAAAGGAVSGTIESASDDDWEMALQTNLMAVMRLCRAAADPLKVRSGRIVIFGAVSAAEPRADHVVSNVCKAGVTVLAKTLSRELAGYDILTNCIAPGRIRSGQLDRAFPDEQARRAFAADRIPLGRFGDAKEVVPLTLLLGSALNTYVTGQTIAVDGGMSMSY